MPDEHAAALAQADRALRDASEFVRSVVRSRRGSVPAHTLGALHRASDRIAHAQALVGPAPASVVPQHAGHVAGHAVGVAARGARFLPNIEADQSAAERVLDEATRLAVAALVAGAVSNARRHRPRARLRVALGATSSDGVIVMSGAPPQQLPPMPDWPVLGDAALALEAGLGLRLMDDLARRAGGVLHVWHLPAYTAVGIAFPGGDQSADGEGNSIAPLVRRVAAVESALAEHGAVSVLTGLQPLLGAGERALVARAVTALRRAGDEVAAFRYEPMQLDR